MKFAASLFLGMCNPIPYKEEPWNYHNCNITGMANKIQGDSEEVICPSACENIFSFNKIHDEEVLKTVNELWGGSGAGWDGLKFEHLKLISKFIVAPLKL